MYTIYVWYLKGFGLEKLIGNLGMVFVGGIHKERKWHVNVSGWLDSVISDGI